MATNAASLKTKSRADTSTTAKQAQLASSSLYSSLASVMQVIKTKAILIVLVAALTYLLSSVFTITVLAHTVNLTAANEGVKLAVAEAQNTERSLQVRFSAASSLGEIKRYALSNNMGMIEAHPYKQLPVGNLQIIVLS